MAQGEPENTPELVQPTISVGANGSPPDDRTARLKRLAEKAASLPRTPGVYFMKDAKGVVVYVGKALRLRERVGSYFVPSADLGLRKQPMLDLIEDFDTLECETEWEALLAENRLIKDTRPKFNASLSDDRTFPYLVITTREDYPGVFITREPGAERFKGARVFGPFLGAHALRHAIETLQKVFRFRTCDLVIEEGDPRNRFFRPCLLHAIGRCSAPCAARVTKDAYGTDIERFTRFLSSKRSDMLREMRAEMSAASAGQNYERAAALRDQVHAIEKLEARGSVREGWQPEAERAMYIDPRKGLRSLQKTLGLPTPIRCLEAIDIAHLGGGETVGSKVCFVDGRPLKSQYRRFKVQTVANDDYAAIREVVSRRYRDAGEGNELYPDVILIDGGLGQLHAAMQAFETLSVKPAMVISLAKKEELIFAQERSEPIRLGRENPGLRLCQALRDEAHRFAQRYHHLLRKKKTLEEE